MIKTRKISSERQKQEKYYWNDKNKKCHPELFPFVILSVSEGSFVVSLPRNDNKKYILNIFFLSSRTHVRDFISNCYYFLLLLFRLFKYFNNIHLLFLIYRISSLLLVNTISFSKNYNSFQLPHKFYSKCNTHFIHT